MRTEPYFHCTDRDRAAFEAGIKLGALFHQYIGSPVNDNSAPYMEEAIRMAMLAQPYVRDAWVRIDREVLAESKSTFHYAPLSERMLNAGVEIEYKGVMVRATLGWVEDIGYPLMRIDSVEEPPERACR